MSNPYDRLSEQKLPSRIAESVRLEGARKQAVEIGRTRLVVVAAVFACAFLVLAGRLVHLSSIGEGGSTSLANEGSGELGLARAEILDRNGVLLASDLGTASLYADPRRVLDAAEAANQISRVLPDIDRSALFSKLTTSKRFVWVKRHLTPPTAICRQCAGIAGNRVFRGTKTRLSAR